MNIKNVLYLCTQNSARSIIAEAITNYKYSESLKGFSAGSTPSGIINPKTLDLLDEMKIPTEKLYSKSWDVFGESNSPSMDYVVTVCGNAAKETCPIWPGAPKTFHFNIEDPVKQNLNEDDHKKFFRSTFDYIDQLIKENLLK
tara:strand:+ start:1534 stop:1962 length:429 start_codon:yes stop_codon:yes gene_type:complete